MCKKEHEHEEHERDVRAMFDMGVKARLPNVHKVHVHNKYM